MTREEKCKLAIEKGYTYDKITGKIYGIRVLYVCIYMPYYYIK